MLLARVFLGNRACCRRCSRLHASDASSGSCDALTSFLRLPVKPAVRRPRVLPPAVARAADCTPQPGGAGSG